MFCFAGGGHGVFARPAVLSGPPAHQTSQAWRRCYDPAVGGSITGKTTAAETHLSRAGVPIIIGRCRCRYLARVKNTDHSSSNFENIATTFTYFPVKLQAGLFASPPSSQCSKTCWAALGRRREAPASSPSTNRKKELNTLPSLSPFRERKTKNMYG